MRTFSTCAAVASLLVVFAGACGPKADPSQQPAVAPTATGYAYPTATAPAGYPAQAPAGYPAQPAYTAQPAPTYAPAPTSPTAAPAGTMAVPGPVAFTCTNDVPCGTHHCNTQYGKCAFPCATNTDCITPNACVMGLCVPQMPAGH